MKFPVIRKSYFLNITILLISLYVSWFALLLGIAHLIEAFNGGNHDSNIPIHEIIIGWIMVLLLCVIGILFLMIAIGSIKGIIYKLKKKKS